MELRRYAHLLRRRIVLLVLATAVGLSAGFLASNRTPEYRAESSIYVGSRQFTAIMNFNDARVAMDQLTATFAALIKSTPVASAAIQRAHVPRTPAQVVSETLAAAIPNTNYIVVTVTDPDPASAQSLADGLAGSFVSEVQTLEPGTGEPGQPSPTSVFAEASLPKAPNPTSTKRDVVLGGVLALAAAVALVTMLNYLDISVKSPLDIERRTGVPVLGTIPALSRAAAGSGPVLIGPSSPPGAGAE